jgi:hypothetical protein
MKRLLIFACFYFAVMAGITGCYKDVILPKQGANPNAPPVLYSYKADIAPIFNTRCALSGCHVAGSQVPDLETTVSWNSLVNGGYVNTLFPEQSEVYIQINGNMQVHIPDAVERQMIYDWIRTGALNN